MTITIKDSEGIAGMRVAGRLAAEVLDYLTPHVKPGVTTNELDRLATTTSPRCRVPFRRR
jgi:methionyl aminopeptidase